MTDIKSKLVDQLESMVGSQITRVAPTLPREPSGSGRTVDDKSIVGNLKNIYSGTPDQMRAALSFFQGLNQDVVDMIRTPTGLEIKKSDGSSVTIPMTNEDGSPKDIRIFIEESVNQLTKSGVKDVNKAINQANITGEEVYNPASARFTVRQKPTTGSLMSAVDQSVLSKVNPDRFSQKSPELTNYLNSSLGYLGIVATDVSGAFNNVVEVRIPGAVGVDPIRISGNNNSSDSAKEVSKLVDYLKKGLATKFTGKEEELMNIIGGGVPSGGSGSQPTIETVKAAGGNSR
jgi:hypothetical protein